VIVEMIPDVSDISKVILSSQA